MLNKKYNSLTTVLLCIICLSGCNKTSEEEIALVSFSSSIENFTNCMKDANEKINNLDANKKESVAELLSILDDMNMEAAKLQELEIPSQYIGIQEPVNMTVENMSSAVSYYHSAYEADSFNETDADIAYRYYQLSMEGIKYMGYVIAGDEIPENDHVTVSEVSNDNNLLDKWLFGDKEEETETTSETNSEAVN